MVTINTKTVLTRFSVAAYSVYLAEAGQMTYLGNGASEEAFAFDQSLYSAVPVKFEQLITTMFTEGKVHVGELSEREGTMGRRERHH